MTKSTIDSGRDEGGDTVTLSDAYRQKLANQLSNHLDDSMRYIFKGGTSYSEPIKIKQSYYKRLGQRLTRWLMDKFDIYEGSEWD